MTVSSSESQGFLRLIVFFYSPWILDHCWLHCLQLFSLEINHIKSRVKSDFSVKFVFGYFFNYLFFFHHKTLSTHFMSSNSKGRLQKPSQTLTACLHNYCNTEHLRYSTPVSHFYENSEPPESDRLDAANNAGCVAKVAQYYESWVVLGAEELDLGDQVRHIWAEDQNTALFVLVEMTQLNKLIIKYISLLKGFV